MSRHSMQLTTGPMELQDLKRDVRPARETLQQVSSDAGRLVDQAISAAGMKRETLAGEMGISPSLLTRQIQNADNQHLSFQRLWSESVSERFKRELLIAMAVDVEGVSVRTLLVLEKTA